MLNDVSTTRNFGKKLGVLKRKTREKSIDVEKMTKSIKQNMVRERFGEPSIVVAAIRRKKSRWLHV